MLSILPKKKNVWSRQQLKIADNGICIRACRLNIVPALLPTRRRQLTSFDHHSLHCVTGQVRPCMLMRQDKNSTLCTFDYVENALLRHGRRAHGCLCGPARTFTPSTLDFVKAKRFWGERFLKLQKRPGSFCEIGANTGKLWASIC